MSRLTRSIRNKQQSHHFTKKPRVSLIVWTFSGVVANGLLLFQS